MELPSVKLPFRCCNKQIVYSEHGVFHLEDGSTIKWGDYRYCGEQRMPNGFCKVHDVGLETVHDP